MPVVQVKSRYCLPFPPQINEINSGTMTRIPSSPRQKQEAVRYWKLKVALEGTLVRSVLSQDSMKSIAGDDAKARYEMHRSKYYYDKNKNSNSKHLQKFQ